MNRLLELLKTRDDAMMCNDRNLAREYQTLALVAGYDLKMRVLEIAARQVVEDKDQY